LGPAVRVQKADDLTNSTSLYLDINAGDMSTAVELNVMFLLVDWIIVNTRVLAGVPVKHKLTVVQTTDSLLAPSDSEVALLKLEVTHTILVAIFQVNPG